MTTFFILVLYFSIAAGAYKGFDWANVTLYKDPKRNKLFRMVLSLYWPFLFGSAVVYTVEILDKMQKRGDSK